MRDGAGSSDGGVAEIDRTVSWERRRQSTVRLAEDAVGGLSSGEDDI